LQLQQRDESTCFRLVGHEAGEHSGEAEALLDEVEPQPLIAGTRRIPLGED
jgi:hypothetical protein